MQQDITVFILAAGVIISAFVFAFVNGFHDGCNVLATMVSSRSLSPRYALILGALSEFLGALFFGGAVAKTVGLGILNVQIITLWVVLAATLGAIAWNLITWYRSIPSSSSHALLGGLIGAVVAESFFLNYSSFEAIQWSKVAWVLFILVISAPIGLILGFLFTKLSFFLARGASPKANSVFKRLQILSSFFIGVSHGSNDAPKTMGLIMMALILVRPEKTPSISFIIPGWVLWMSALFLALGVLKVGWRIMRTVGTKLYKVRPIHGFGAQTSASLVIFISSVLGFPVSTTQIVNSAVVGAGSAERPKAVRWLLMKNILLTWLITIPGAAIIAAALYTLMRLITR